jgi:hypothetical protein
MCCRYAIAHRGRALALALALALAPHHQAGIVDTACTLTNCGIPDYPFGTSHTSALHTVTVYEVRTLRALS